MVSKRIEKKSLISSRNNKDNQGSITFNAAEVQWPVIKVFKVEATLYLIF